MSNEEQNRPNTGQDGGGVGEVDDQPIQAVQRLEAGLGVLSYEDQAENWKLAIAKIRVIVQRWGIEFPAIPELDIEGVDVSADINPEDIIPVF